MNELETNTEVQSLKEEQAKALNEIDTAIEMTERVGQAVIHERQSRMKDQIVEQVFEKIMEKMDDYLLGYRQAIIDLRHQLGHATTILNMVFKKEGIDFNPPQYLVKQVETVADDRHESTIIVRFEQEDEGQIKLQYYSFDANGNTPLDLSSNVFLHKAIMADIQKHTDDRFEPNKDYYFEVNIIQDKEGPLGPEAIKVDEEDDE